MIDGEITYWLLKRLLDYTFEINHLSLGLPTNQPNNSPNI
jgi:hypothetical protein